MKKINYLLLCMLTLCLMSSCKKEQDILFEMAYERDFNIPAGLNVFQTHYIYLRDISIGSYLSSNNVNASDLAAINPGSARMSAIFSGLSDYSFIRQVEVQIFGADENAAREVFYRLEIPLNTGEDLDIIPGLADIKPFFENDKFTIIIKLQLRAVPTQTIETKFRFSFLAK